MRLKDAILWVIAEQGDGYGLDLADRMKARFPEDNISPKPRQGTLYPALRELEGEGFLESYEGDPLPERGNRARRYYKLTEKGRELAGHKDTIIDKPPTHKKPADLTGYYMPLREGSLVVFEFAGAQGKFIPLFSTQGKLVQFMKNALADFEGAARIADPEGLLKQAWADGLRVAIDPHKTDKGRMRWEELHNQTVH